MILLLAPLLLVGCAADAGEGDRGPTSEPRYESVVVRFGDAAVPDGGVRTVTEPLVEALEAAGVPVEVHSPVVPDGALVIVSGADADALWRVVEPVLRHAGLGPGVEVVLTYRSPGKRDARIDLG